MTPATPAVPLATLGVLAPETASLAMLVISGAILLFPFALGFVLSERPGGAVTRDYHGE